MKVEDIFFGLLIALLAVITGYFVYYYPHETAEFFRNIIERGR